MIFNKNNLDSIEYNNKLLYINKNITVIDDEMLEGLSGQIIEIRTDNDKETENEGNIEIVVSLNIPTDKKLYNKVNNDIIELTDGNYNIESFGIDLVILTPDSII